MKNFNGTHTHSHSLLLFTLFVVVVYLLTETESLKIIRTVVGIPPFGGDGKYAVNAYLTQPKGIFYNPSRQDLFIADSKNHVIRKVDKNGIISTVAGTPGRYFIESISNEGFNSPSSVFQSTLDNQHFFIADTYNHAIKKVIVRARNTIFQTIAGGIEGSIGDGGDADQAQLRLPSCVFAVKTSNITQEIYICDYANHAIRKVFANGTIITIAGVLEQGGNTGSNGALATASKLFLPASVYVTRDNQQMFISDLGNNQIKRVFLKNGTMYTIAGVGESGYSGDSGPALQARFNYPYSIYLRESAQELYVADTQNCAIRKIFLRNQTIVTISGQGNTQCGHTGDGGLAVNAKLNQVSGLFVQNDGTVWISDTLNNVVRQITTSGIIQTVAGFNSDSSVYSNADKYRKLKTPRRVYITSQNEMFIADSGNYVIKKVDTNGQISLVAGQLAVMNPAPDNLPAPAINTTLSFVNSMTMNEQTQELFIAEQSGYIRKISLTTGIISTIIAGLNNPTGLYYHSATNSLLFSEPSSHVVKKLILSSMQVSIIAGSVGVPMCDVDGGLAINTKLSNPTAVIVSRKNTTLILDSVCSVVKNISSITGRIGSLYSIPSFFIKPDMFLQESTNSLYILESVYLRRVNLANGTAEIIAGKEDQPSFQGDNLEPLNTVFKDPNSVFVTNSGTPYIVDTNNNIVRKILDQCQDYVFSFELSGYSSDKNAILTARATRACQLSQGDYFDMDYLPRLQLRYNTATDVDADFRTFVLNDWSNSQVFTANLEDQMLDLVATKVSACYEPYIESACSSNEILFGITPIASSTNFIFIPGIVSATAIHFYKLSSSVSSLQISYKFINSVTNTVDLTSIASTATAVIEGLRPSTLYFVNISATVVYSNGLTLQSDTTTQSVQTLVGIPPSGNVNNVKMESTSPFAFLITWDAIASDAQGNVPVSTIEMEYSSAIMDTSIVSISYNPQTNSPSFYEINTPSKFFAYKFSIRIRSCSAVGCGNFTEPFTGSFEADTASLISLVVPIATVGGICIFLILVVIFISLIIIVTVIVVKKSKKGKRVVALQMELQDEAIKKEFRIDEKKLDFGNSTVIGRGAFGSVFSAKYFNIDVAVKLIPKQSMGVDTDLTDFKNELKFLNSNAQHQNIIRFFGVYESKESNSVGFVMELCPNGNIANYIERNKDLPFPQKLHLLQGIANGMQYLHHHNIAHRDLKCENVLLDAQMVPKIIDFGYSKEINEQANKSLNLTMNIGTAAYCAPEVIKMQFHNPSLSMDSSMNNSLSHQGTPTSPLSIRNSTKSLTSDLPAKQLAYDKRCDVYSFAIIIWVVYFQNKNPYGNVTDNQILFQLSKSNDFRPKVEDAKIPENEKWLVSLMKQCWSTNAEQRPSFDEICRVLSDKAA